MPTMNVVSSLITTLFDKVLNNKRLMNYVKGNC